MPVTGLPAHPTSPSTSWPQPWSELPLLEDVTAIAFAGVLVILLVVLPVVLVVRDLRSGRSDPEYDGPTRRGDGPSSAG